MKVVHVKKEPFDLYIGRQDNRSKPPFKKSKWNNPFLIDKTDKKRDGTREEVLEKYRQYLLYNEQFGKNLPDGRELLKDLPELRGKILGCWCRPERCHGDILIELMSNREGS